jgi:hypothetical protein
MQKAKHIEQIGFARGVRANDKYAFGKAQVALAEIAPILQREPREPWDLILH